jgi:hypothetical protein
MNLLESAGAFVLSLLGMVALRMAWYGYQDTQLDIGPGEYRTGAAIAACTLAFPGIVVVATWRLVQSAALVATAREVISVVLCLAGFVAAEAIVKTWRKRHMSDYWIIRYYVATDPADPDGPWRRWQGTGLLSSRQEAERALERCHSLKPDYHFGAHRLKRAEWVALQSA